MLRADQVELARAAFESQVHRTLLGRFLIPFVLSVVRADRLARYGSHMEVALTKTLPALHDLRQLL